MPTPLEMILIELWIYTIQRNNYSLKKIMDSEDKSELDRSLFERRSRLR